MGGDGGCYYSGSSGCAGFSGYMIGVRKHAPFGIGQWVMDKMGDLFFIQSYYKGTGGSNLVEDEVFYYGGSNDRRYSEHEIEAAPGFPKVPSSWPEDVCARISPDREFCCWHFREVGPHHQSPPCPHFLATECWLSRCSPSKPGAQA